MRSPVVSLRRDLVRLKSAKSFEALLVELDHLLRGTGSKARSAGEVLTPFGLLREAVLVEGEENLLLVRTKTPEASRVAVHALAKARDQENWAKTLHTRSVEVEKVLAEEER